jgi:hypothetical protein
MAAWLVATPRRPPGLEPASRMCAPPHVSPIMQWPCAPTAEGGAPTIILDPCHRPGKTR